MYTLYKSVEEAQGEEYSQVAASSKTSTNENSHNISSDGWAYPTDTDATERQPFILNAHNAVDIAKNGDVPIFAAHDGVVTAAGDISYPPYIQPCDSGTGIQQVVIIKHDINGETFFSSYHHVAKGSITVSPGDQVKAGDKIAMMGTTGCSTGQHLHFEIWKNSIYGNGTPIDPNTIVKR
jgi:murein DD-endopeptidase MepM/ murein hydrolase activator NlpD